MYKSTGPYAVLLFRMKALIAVPDSKIERRASTPEVTAPEVCAPGTFDGVEIRVSPEVGAGVIVPVVGCVGGATNGGEGGARPGINGTNVVLYVRDW